MDEQYQTTVADIERINARVQELADRIIAQSAQPLAACEAALPVLTDCIPPNCWDNRCARALVMVRDAIREARERP